MGNRTKNPSSRNLLPCPKTNPAKKIIWHDSYSFLSTINELLLPYSTFTNPLLPSTQVVPLILDCLALTHNISIPQSSNHKKSESEICHSYGHVQTQRRHAMEGFVVTLLSVFTRRGRFPNIQILKNVTEGVSID